LRPDRKLGRNVHEPPKVQHQTESQKMCFWGFEGEAAWIHLSKRGIEATPPKIMAISNMGPIRNSNGVQRLTGYLAALS
jgi:hypothetical protein